MKPNDFDVMIIGAGAAGLMAALKLVQGGKSVAIMEAKDRIGGRIQTIRDDRFPFPVEAGAEFIHGNLPVTLELVKIAGLEYKKVEGAMWRHDKEGFQKEEEEIKDEDLVTLKLRSIKEDISIASFIDQYLSDAKHVDARESLRNYVEGYYAADATDASTLFLKEEWQQGGEEQYRINEGYQKLIDHIQHLLQEKECTIFLKKSIKEVYWRKDKVEVRTATRFFTAKKLIITASLGVLRTSMIKWYPALPHIAKCARAMGFGAAIKILLLFDKPFWLDRNQIGGKRLSDMAFLFSNEKIPTWWTMFPEETPLLVGWLAGPKAQACVGLSEDELLQKSLSSLGRLFNLDVMRLHQKLLSWHVTNWGADPHMRGGYSYETIHSKEARATLKTPVDNTLFFAGEALYEGAEIGTVEAALHSGSETAQQVLDWW